MNSQLSGTLVSEPEQFTSQLQSLFEDSVPELSDIMPSDWTEQNMVMGKPFPGPFRYNRTPYTREIIDCLSPRVAVNKIVVKKGAQIGFSTGVIYPGIGWIIKNSPGNTYLSVGAPNLVEPAMAKVDAMLDATGTRSLISAQSNRKKNSKTGDTNKKKEFPNGYLMVTSANNHKDIRQLDFQYKFLDDLAAIKKKSKESGNTLKKLDTRSAAYADIKKDFLITTPELKLDSNIDEEYELGDKRRYFIPCPCCKEMITIEWETESKKVAGKMAGITWGFKENGQLDKEKVGYICQLCDEFFTDRDKMDWLNKGEWRPTCVPKVETTRSYHISALYAPIGMDGWDKYVADFLQANPDGQPRKEDIWQVFVNECLGESYEPPGISLKSSALAINNTSDYKIGVVPEKISIAHGNGRAVMITCAADLGGLVAGINSTYDDVRLDWERKVWMESGSSYSLDHGSIGSFTPAHMGKKDEAREIWSYDLSKPNNVWKEFIKIINTPVEVDGTGNKMGVAITGIDTGFAEHQAFSFIDRCNYNVIGVKGDKEYKYTMRQDNTPIWKASSARSKLYIIRVGRQKDRLSEILQLRWDKGISANQPPGFMNFPKPVGNMYGLEGFFMHYEAEERKEDKDGNYMWMKKTPTSQNHFFDVANYGLTLKDILMTNVLKEAKIVNGTWTDFCELLLKARTF
jgi:phage terminase large subunit GpA-like protein